MSYTMNEAASVLKISRRRLTDLVQEFPYYYSNGIRKLFTQQDIDNLVEAMRNRPHKDPRYRVKRTTVPSQSPDRALERALKLLADR